MLFVVILVEVCTHAHIIHLSARPSSSPRPSPYRQCCSTFLFLLRKNSSYHAKTLSMLYIVLLKWLYWYRPVVLFTSSPYFILFFLTSACNISCLYTLLTRCPSPYVSILVWKTHCIFIHYHVVMLHEKAPVVRCEQNEHTPVACNRGYCFNTKTINIKSFRS